MASRKCRIATNVPKTNHTHADRRDQLEEIVAFNPRSQDIREPDKFAKTCGHSFAAKTTKNHPRFQRAKPAAELDAVIHVIFLRLDRVAAQIFRHKREDAPQPLEVTHVKDAEIQRDKKTFVRIYDDGIRFTPTVSQRLFLWQNGEARAVSAVNVKPQFIFAADGCDLGNGINACG